MGRGTRRATLPQFGEAEVDQAVCLGCRVTGPSAAGERGSQRGGGLLMAVLPQSPAAPACRVHRR